MYGQQATSRYSPDIVPTTLGVSLIRVSTLSFSGCLPTPDTLALPTRLTERLQSCFSPAGQHGIPITYQGLAQRLLSRQ